MDDNHTPASEYPNQKEALSVILITLILSFLLGVIGIIVGLSRTELFLVELFIIVPAVVFVYLKRLPPMKVFRLYPINFKIVLLSILIGLSLSVLSDELDRIISLVFPMPDAFIDAMEKAVQINSTTDLILIIFSAVFLAAVCEELLFRGFLQTSFENAFDVTKSVMLTALLFAVVHFNPWWTIQLIVFGIFLGVLSWKSNSVYPGIIVHAVNNGLSLAFQNTDESLLDWYIWKDHVSPLLVFIAGIGLVYGFKLFYRNYEEQYGENRQRTKS